jgi:hypothetical protein
LAGVAGLVRRVELARNPPDVCGSTWMEGDAGPR